MCEAVYISWQDPKDRRWFVVGRLSEKGPGYQFVYTKGALNSPNFIPFPDMKDLKGVYFDSKLFPLFSNRLLGQRRAEFREFIDWLNLSTEERSPLDILSRSGGGRETDSFQVFRKVDVAQNGDFSTVFFLHGLSHVGKGTEKRVGNLQPEESLRLALDVQNPVDENSVTLVATPTEIIGFVPRYLSRDIALLLREAPESVKASVVAIHNSAPLHYRLLCKIEGKVPEAIAGKVFNSEEFVPIGDARQ